MTVDIEMMTVEQLKATIANLKLEAEQREARQAERDATQNKQYDDLQKIGNCAMDSIRDMVAAVECDYDRLEELRDAKRDLENEVRLADHEDSEELATRTASLEEWNAENAEELATLEAEAGDCTSREDAEQRIQNDPLSLEYRSGWTSPGDKMEAEEFCLLLSTGGPATRIVGELRNGEAYLCRLESQDWYTPWTECRESDSDTLATYCNIVGVGAGIE